MFDYYETAVINNLDLGKTMRILTNICADDLQKSKEFYVDLLGFKVKYDSEWYVQLCLPDNSEIEYGNELEAETHTK